MEAWLAIYSKWQLRKGLVFTAIWWNYLVKEVYKNVLRNNSWGENKPTLIGLLGQGTNQQSYFKTPYSVPEAVRSEEQKILLGIPKSKPMPVSEKLSNLCNFLNQKLSFI